MGEVLNFAFEKEKQLQNGIKMIVEVLEDVETEGEPTDTSDHEVIHMLLLYFGGTGFYYGTNKAEGNTLGHVMPKGHDSVAAIGPHALGKGGTGHDRMLAHYANDNEEAVASIARSRMSGKNHYRRVFGLELDKRRILTESDAEHIIDIVNKGKRISVRFVMPDGSEHRTGKRGFFYSKKIFIFFFCVV